MNDLKIGDRVTVHMPNYQLHGKAGTVLDIYDGTKPRGAHMVPAKWHDVKLDVSQEPFISFERAELRISAE